MSYELWVMSYELWVMGDEFSLQPFVIRYSSFTIQPNQLFTQSAHP